MQFRTTNLLISFGAVVFALLQGACNSYSVPVKAPVPHSPPPADTARVFFINPGSDTGDPSTFIMKETELIGYLESKSVSYVDLPEGEHFFISVSTNHEGVFARLAGGKTYYLLLTFERGPDNALGGRTAAAYWEPLVPGGDGWERRHQWVDRAKLVALNEKRAELWNNKYARRNQEWFEQFRNGEKKYTSLLPSQGE